MCIPTHIGAEISNTKKYSLEVRLSFLRNEGKAGVTAHTGKFQRSLAPEAGFRADSHTTARKRMAATIRDELTGDRPGDVHWLHLFFHFDIRDRRPQDRGRSAAYRG